MEILTYSPKDFPLTHKWHRLIGIIAYHNKFHVNEGIQEALILEWTVREKIQDLTHRENYFKKVLYQRLYGIGRDWWARHKVSLQSESLEDSSDIIDKIIQVRPFDEIYFEELILHVSQMLYQIDITASEIFLIRMRTTYLWKKIREVYFKEMSYNRYCNKVRLIKDTTLHELVYA